MLTRTSSRVRIPRHQFRSFRPSLELLEDRLPPGDVFWTSRWPLAQFGNVGAAHGSERVQALFSHSADPFQPREQLLAFPWLEMTGSVVQDGIESPAIMDSAEVVPTPATTILDWQTPPAASASVGLSGLWTGQSGGQTAGAVESGASLPTGSVPSSGLAPLAQDVATAPAALGLFAALNSAQRIQPRLLPQPGNEGASTQSVVDLTVANIEVTQAIQRPNNSVGLVANRATMVRIYVGTGGSATPIPNVRAEMYVYRDYVEIPGSPFFPINNSISAKRNPDRALENDTLNFVLPSLSGNIMLVPVVYAWGSEEANWGNNYTFLEGLQFNCRRSPSIAYLPTDYRPTGGTTPNLPNPALIAPGVGDDFVQAIYPFPNVNYTQAPGGPLLWTQNINSSTSPYFNALNQRRQLTSPTPDILYGWLPGNPFSGNGAAMVNGRVSFGNTEQSRYLRTFAHELGHNFGLQHNNRRLAPEVGVDVNNTLGLGRMKSSSLYDIMVGGQLTNQAFVDVQTYTHFYNHSLSQCGAEPGSAPGGEANGDYLFVTGLIDAAGRPTLNPTYRLEGQTAYSKSDPQGAYLLRVHTTDGAVRDLRFAATSSLGNGHEPGCGCAACAGAAFALTIPNDPTISRLEVLREDRVEDRLTRSASAPVGGFAAAPAVLQGATTLAWSAADADGDPLTYSIQYSPDGGRTLIPLAVSETGTRVAFNADVLPPSPNGMLRLLITDGLNTTTVEQSVAVVAAQ